MTPLPSSAPQFDQAREFFQRGIAHFHAGRLDEAGKCFSAALALVPGRPSALTNLGAVRLKLGFPEEALDLLDESLEKEPEDPDALGLRAASLAELGRHEEALVAFDRVLEVAPTAGRMWMLRGSLLTELGRHEEAARSFEHSLANGGDAELNRYYLAAASKGKPPPTAPRDYVESLFDRYSTDFDVQLVEHLKYRAPKVLADHLATLGRRYSKVLDLGCGTGLCGRIAHSIMLHITGVDISAGMLEKARESGAYEELVQADIVEYLRSAPARYDLVVSADVFIYVGALDEVFEHVHRVLQPGGIFCFSVEEAGDDEGMVLRESRRYAHSEAYVRELARSNSLAVTKVERAPIREGKRVPIPGIYFWLTRNA